MAWGSPWLSLFHEMSQLFSIVICANLVISPFDTLVSSRSCLSVAKLACISKSFFSSIRHIVYKTIFWIVTKLFRIHCLLLLLLHHATVVFIESLIVFAGLLLLVASVIMTTASNSIISRLLLLLQLLLLKLVALLIITLLVVISFSSVHLLSVMLVSGIWSILPSFNLVHSLLKVISWRRNWVSPFSRWSLKSEIISSVICLNWNSCKLRSRINFSMTYTFN